jgi:membrane fusion protein (multidrug efflux system)
MAEKKENQENEVALTPGKGFRRLLPATVVLGGIAAVALMAMMPGRRNNPQPVELTPVNVVVEAVRPVPEMRETFDLPGAVEPNRTVKVAAEVSGQVESYGLRTADATWRGRLFPKAQPLDEGQPVEEGAVLVVLNKDILQAERDRSEAQYRYDQSEHQRLADLLRRGAAAPREVDEAATRAAVSQAVLKAAQERLDRTVIRSPLRGILNRFPVEVGEYVEPGRCVAEIVDLDQVKVVLDVPERDVGFLAVGREESVSLGPNGENSLAGPVTYISELADAQTHASRVEITLDNRQQKLRSGQIVQVHLTRRLLKDAIMVPLGAVIPLEDGREVYVVEGGKAQPRKVELGFMKGYSVQVVSGLSEGDRLIVDGHRYVGAGQAVNVVGKR